MPVKVKKQGHYKLLKTNHGHTILDLDDKDYYAWIEGQQGEILVHSDSHHEFKKTEQEGDFKFVDFEDDPEYQDMPHLFLEEGGKYREVVLPNGLPTKKDHQKKIVDTHNKLSKKDVEDYLENPKPAGGGSNRRERAGGENDPNLPIDDYAAKTVSEIKDEVKDLSKDELKKVKKHEEEHKDRKTAEQAIESELKKKQS